MSHWQYEIPWRGRKCTPSGSRSLAEVMNERMVVIGRTAPWSELASFFRMDNLWSVYHVGVVLAFGRARKYRGSGHLSTQALKEGITYYRLNLYFVDA